MKPKTISWMALAGLLLAGGIAFAATSRAGYESAGFVLISKEGDFEIRRYKPLVVVSTPMQDGENNGSFGRLFNYISGRNEGNEKIAMTTPVFMPSGEGGEPGEMQFVVPAAVAEAGPPKPSDPEVRLAKMSGGVYGVLRYSGRSSATDRRKALDNLKARLKEAGKVAVGDPVYAGYDPPWTPGPMRRNEVLIRLK